MSARTRKDWILWSALGCALAGTAHAEYTLAVAAHFNEWVALAVPGALDLYVIRALQQRRDVFVAVLAMVAANVAAHLVVAGVLPVEWPVVSAVGAVAPLIVWRVYSLKYESGAVSAPAPEDECTALVDALVAGQALEYGPRMQWGALPGPEAPSAPAPDRIPAWMSDEYPPSAPHSDTSAGALDAPGPPSALRSKTSAVTRPVSVPDLPPEYVASAVHSESPLTERDRPFLPSAQRYVDDVADPSVRGLMKAINVGQDRAGRLLTHLGVIL